MKFKFAESFSTVMLLVFIPSPDFHLSRKQEVVLVESVPVEPIVRGEVVRIGLHVDTVKCRMCAFVVPPAPHAMTTCYVSKLLFSV